MKLSGFDEELVPRKMKEGVLYEGMPVHNGTYLRVWRDPETHRPYIRRTLDSQDLFGEPEYGVTSVSERDVMPVILRDGVLTELRKHRQRSMASLRNSGQNLRNYRSSSPLGEIKPSPTVDQPKERLRGPRVVVERGVPARKAIEDFGEYDERPDPLQTSSAEEFLEALREYRIWAGEPSFRKMSDNCRHKIAYSTLNTALNGGRLPKLHIVEAFIEGCGGDRDDVRRWATAWRKLRKREGAIPSSGPWAAVQIFEFIDHASQVHNTA
ncbi:hypothetical protein [Nocardiopsis dassonvillei]|uniref:Uncharacterized protein n=1 Tax=Nocardiopsis dassonvillei (strain ATCC 23218 / DSM 43111 / CIP 107115 / JCM 7437 / KCTC 9190 / NBRC 14626 / NCTC 10488 / NRRL B-5397 / IMRU 509) TaxID=446468 RepID=D7AXZ1_NOCDD|nr:hypothetical protein [Nocardiopsis dassonvillei]ADH69869.1 hypothetical protein Ndas_4481 [Nocardiopsis dassonvillei subsp. dassonvillei DSM 43111]NKY78911.1 hypothetical protein [Nocardiopsis dassonvillei]VEI90382.1 Uncharacterised protein [Nocardiopsis dassonvillei]